MNNRRLTIFLLSSLAALLLVVIFWPKHEKLPVLEEIEFIPLEDVHGKEYDFQDNKIKLVTFFYTNCPDICPMTMVDLQKMQETLKADGLFGEKVHLVAISLDPENDTASVITEYASGFEADSKGWKWLRGTSRQTRAIADQLKMQYEKIEGDFFSHSTTMYLIDSDNRVRGLYDMAYSNRPVEKEKIIKDIQLLVTGP